MELAIAKILGMQHTSRDNSWGYWVPRSREGLPKTALLSLLQNLEVSIAEISHLLPVSERTLQRYPEEKRLSADLSGHIVAMAKVYAKAAETFENQDKARRWLHKPCRALGGAVPLSLLDTPLGIQAVEDELVRIEHGVYA